MKKETYTVEEIEQSKQCLKDIISLHQLYGGKVFTLTMSSLNNAFAQLGVKFDQEV